MTSPPNALRGSEDTSGTHWLSVSDLMAGLMVIFLFVAITYIRPILNQQKTIREIVVAWHESEVNLYNDLLQEFENDLPRWNAELDRPTLSVRFKEPDVLFDAGATSLKPAFREILDDFFPRYLATISKFRDSVAEIRIEGHTSSEWAFETSADDAYFLNMNLSQGRTRQVLEYCLRMPEVADETKWARSTITANGLSSSQPILVDGHEDRRRSRRVEFRVRTNTKRQIVTILENVEQ